MSNPPDLQKLIDESNACKATCHDRSCSRMGYCTGGPGNAVQSWHADNKLRQAEEAKYREFKRLMDRYNAEK